jgi:hypothetical protein
MSDTSMLSKLGRSFPVVVIALISFSTVWAQPPSQPWTTVGSAGTVDPASLLFAEFGNPIPVFIGDTRDIGAITALDFVNNSYYVDVQLTQPQPNRLFEPPLFTSRPALGMIKLEGTPCVI